MIIKSIFFVSLFTFFNAHADTLSDFQSRFEVTHNSNNETVINDKKLLEGVSIQNFVVYLSDLFQTKTVPQFNTEKCAAANYDQQNAELFKMAQQTVGVIAKFNFGQIINSPEFANFLNKFDAEFNKFIAQESIISIANLDNSTYFYKANTTGYIIGKLKDLIMNTLGMPGGAKLALFFGDYYEGYVLQKRAYDQNILLSYLIKYSADTLGLTQQQHDQALSSIFESRIKAGNVFSAKKESKLAQGNWLGYGKTKVVELQADAQKRWDKNKKLFDSEIRRIDPVFSIAQFKGAPIYINLSQKTGTFTARPPVAFDEQCPDYSYLKRYSYNLVRLGMDVLGVPFSGPIDKLFFEQYKNEIPTEGLLFGVSEMEKSNIGQFLVDQTLNPFIK